MRNSRPTARSALSEVEDRRTEVRGMEAKIAWTQQRRREAEQKMNVAQYAGGRGAGRSCFGGSATADGRRARQSPGKSARGVLHSLRRSTAW